MVTDLNSIEQEKLRAELDRLYGEQERLNALLKVTRNLAGELELESLLFKIMDEVKRILHADRATVFLYDKKRDELWSKVALGLDEEIRFAADKGIAGHVCKTGQVLNIPDAYKDPRFNPDIDKHTGYVTRNILTMPMYNKFHETIGVFQVLNRKDGPFTPENEELLSAVSMIAASAIENAQLYEELKMSFDSFIDTLSTTLDARDYITAGHSRRVTLYAMEIARQMSMEPRDINVLRYAALLHDVGKIGVPEIVLFKDRKLSEEEYEIIKRHANLTKSILQKIHFQNEFKQVPDIASSHHEKINGQGYPEGLKGDQIPIGGKILAVADVFDALTSRRQYRDRMEIEKVMELIDRETGTSFEPFVVYNFKHISLGRLVPILEYGHHNQVEREDLEKIAVYSLKEMVDIRKKTKRTDTESQIDNLFMRYYSRNYRGSNRS